MGRHVPPGAPHGFRLREVDARTLLSGSVLLLLLVVASLTLAYLILMHSVTNTRAQVAASAAIATHNLAMYRSQADAAAHATDTLKGCRDDINAQDDAVASAKDIIAAALPLMRSDITDGDYAAFDGHQADITAALKKIKGVICG